MWASGKTCCTYEDPDNIVEILRQHKAIYQAIRSGDAEAAYKTMRNHINYVIRFFKNRE
jgi:GntR family transcriptional repressor for pyruvate dehydrogenase complex